MLESYFDLKRVEYPYTHLLYPFPFGINKPLKKISPPLEVINTLLIFIFISSILALFMKEQKKGLM